VTALAQHHPNADLDVTDFFCGMGGSSTGLRNAGFEVKLAANHWDRAIETHSANHPDTEHLLGDLQAVDVRYLPRTRALWASPICTEVSPAGGRKKRDKNGQAGPSLFEDHGHIADAAFERTRVTFWEVIRACEVHRYEAVMIENVVEAADWELFDIWLGGMATLGYRVQFVSVSAAHIGDETNPHAPQWRDRLYMTFTREGVPLPDVEPRPLAWCPKCDATVPAVQWWKKPGRHIGKYRQQYLYVCPVGNHGPVEPFVAPAAAAIDWTDLGTRIGDRAELGMRPLAAGTMRRIEMGLRMISDPVMVAAAGNTYDAASGSGNRYLRATDPNGWPMPAQMTSAQNGIAAKFVMATNHDGGPRAFDPDGAPLPTRSTKNGEALVMAEPFVTMLRRNGKATRIGEPLQTFSAGGFHHGLTVPPGSMLMSPASGGKAKSVTEPAPTLVSTTRPMLVIPYRKGARPHPVIEPLSTQATREQHGLLSGEVAIDDCYFRMLHPRESANAQRFPGDYIIHGNRGEQQMQAGNAVAVNVAQWIGGRVARALDGA
jgi:DNA (cytosine-5)-methyltransferase 1